MTTEKVLLLDPVHVRRGWRARRKDSPIDDLVESFQMIGHQIQPISVSCENDRYTLLAGERRLRACKKLGWQVKAVVADPKSELHRIMIQLHENMRRKDFDPIELGDGLKRAKELYEAEHPEVKHGAAGRGRGKPKVPRFTSAVARATKMSETKVKELLAVSDLPDAKRKLVEDAETESARAQAIQKALREVRYANKIEKLEKKAEEKPEPTSDDPAIVPPSVVLRHGDNRDYWLGENIYELLLTDPPYQTDRQALVTHKTRANIDGNFGDWDKLDVGWVVKAAPLLVPGGQILAFSPLEAIGDYKAVCEGMGLTWHGAIIWEKTNPGTVARPVYLSAVEAIIWATKGGGYYFLPWENAGAEECHNVIRGPICGGDERLAHPTQKPLWLLDRLLRRHATTGHRIFDPFAGVGTTLVACKHLGLACVGVEREDEYVRAARARLAAI